jgi:hypothetical protein
MDRLQEIEASKSCCDGTEGGVEDVEMCTAEHAVVETMYLRSGHQR